MSVISVGDSTKQLPEPYIEVLQCQMYGGISPNELDKIDAQRLAEHWWLHNEAESLKQKRDKGS